MPVFGVILIRLDTCPSADERIKLRRQLLADFDPDDFRDWDEGPLHPVIPEEMGVPDDFASCWLDAEVCKPAYEKGYERGAPIFYVKLAEWLEQRMPDGEVWYGNDCSPETTLHRFDSDARRRLLAYYGEVGHEPYYNRFKT